MHVIKFEPKGDSACEITEKTNSSSNVFNVPAPKRRSRRENETTARRF